LLRRARAHQARVTHADNTSQQLPQWPIGGSRLIARRRIDLDEVTRIDLLGGRDYRAVSQNARRDKSASGTTKRRIWAHRQRRRQRSAEPSCRPCPGTELSTMSRDRHLVHGLGCENFLYSVKAPAEPARRSPTRSAAPPPAAGLQLPDSVSVGCGSPPDRARRPSRVPSVPDRPVPGGQSRCLSADQSARHRRHQLAGQVTGTQLPSQFIPKLTVRVRSSSPAPSAPRLVTGPLPRL
jgi:hypothetical protein